jgi:hypothetical protein
MFAFSSGFEKTQNLSFFPSLWSCFRISPATQSTPSDDRLPIQVAAARAAGDRHHDPLLRERTNFFPSPFL